MQQNARGPVASISSAQPKVVALMPAWNAESFITPVLVSWANQTYPNLQVLISDDASTDRTAEICAEFAENLSEFQLIRQPQRLGWVGNTNALLNCADGDYFLFAAHDDLPDPSYVERLLNALEDNPQAVLSFSDFRWRIGMEDTGRSKVSMYLDLENVSDRTERGVRAARNWGTPPSFLIMVAYRGLFRAVAARQVGGLRRHMGGEFSADWPWLLHLSLLGEFVRVPEVLIDKVYWGTNESSQWTYSLRQQFGALIECFKVTGRADLTFRERFRVRFELLKYPLRWRFWKSVQLGRQRKK